jgi:site-specific recombinase XerC
MTKRNGHVPAYRLHKPSGQARVIIARRHIYLGPYGSAESREKYARIIAETAVNVEKPDISAALYQPESLSVNEVILAYWRFAEGYHVLGGEPTKEMDCIREALVPLREHYGLSSARSFGPKSLKALQQHMISRGLCRTLINQRIGRIKRVFKWAVSEELVPAAVFHGLQAVAGLRFGHTEARETEPVKPVPDEHVDAVLPFVTPHVAAMIQLQRLTGTRPCEVVIARPCDIDMSGDVWVYEPEDHKNRWRGSRRLIPIGPKAQAILQPFLDRDPNTYIFSPKESDAWRRENRPVYYQAKRKTPIYPSELRARERLKQERRNQTPKRPKRDRYDTASYRRAITYGLTKARKSGVEVNHWHPNQLRHTRATEIRKSDGIEAAQVVLGHARADVTQVYAEKNLELAMKIARDSG